jgi:hypothetical protein
MRAYDLVMTHQLDADDFFIHRIQRHCAEKGLNFFLIEPLWAQEFHQKLERDQLRPGVLLNMHSEHHAPEDIFHQLVELAYRKQVTIIDPPPVAIACFDKARVHARLQQSGFDLPYTVVVTRQSIHQFRFSPEEQGKLGRPFVIKPAMGYGRRGVVLDAIEEGDLWRSARQWPEGDLLAQEKIVPRQIAGEPAYFRVFYVFGAVWSCWWNCFTDAYRVLSQSEMEEYKLLRLQEIACRLATLTGMNFFSTEVAQDEKGRFVLIDYINDQCHMLTQSAAPQMGVPDEMVAAIARRLVEGAQELLRKK